MEMNPMRIDKEAMGHAYSVDAVGLFCSEPSGGFYVTRSNHGGAYNYGPRDFKKSHVQVESLHAGREWCLWLTKRIYRGLDNLGRSRWLETISRPLTQQEYEKFVTKPPAKPPSYTGDWVEKYYELHRLRSGIVHMRTMD